MRMLILMTIDNCDRGHGVDVPKLVVVIVVMTVVTVMTKDQK